MSQRRLVLPLLAAVIGALAMPGQAQAAWNGLKHFDCINSNANWHFDGLYGRDTTSAVKAFQRAKGLPATGVADKATLTAMNLPTKRTLRCGDGGNDVLVLQRALAAAGFWAGQSGPAPKPTPMPTMRPTPMPTAMPTPRPTAMPTEMPTPMPTPMETMTPEPLVQGVTNEPTLDLRVGTWLVPPLGFWYIPNLGGNSGSYNADFSQIKYLPTADLDLWLGNVGIGGDIVAFNLQNAYFSGPLFTNGTYMYDGHVEYRWDNGFWKALAGYRGLNLNTATYGSQNYGKVGLGFEHPLGLDWLWFNAKLQGGSNFGNSYFVDGQAGLDLHFGAVGIGAGFRNLYMGINGAPATNINGPTANLELKF